MIYCFDVWKEQVDQCSNRVLVEHALAKHVLDKSVQVKHEQVDNRVLAKCVQVKHELFVLCALDTLDCYVQVKHVLAKCIQAVQCVQCFYWMVDDEVL